MRAEASIEETIAATLAIEEDARLYVFDLDPEDFRINEIAYNVVKTLKENPKITSQTFNMKMFERFGKAYSGFLDKAGLSIQLPEWLTLLKAKGTKKKFGDLVFQLGEELKDPETSSERLRELLVNGEGILSSNSKKGYEKADKVAKTVVERAFDTWENGDNTIRLPLVGDIVTPLWGGEQIVIAARPGMGKTALALETAYRLSNSKIKVGFISLEMDSEQLMIRLCQRFVNTSLRYNLPKLSGDERKSFLDGMDELKNSEIYFDDNASQSLGGLLMTIEKMVKIEGVKVVFIDYLQLVTPPKKASRNDEVAAISRALKVLALKENITIVVLSQLNRSVERQESKIPHLPDLRDSGAIEQDADVVTFIFREGYYRKDVEPEKTEFIVAKQRNGVIGTKELYFDLPHLKFEEMSKNE